MYKINEDLSIYVTRGDTVLFDVKANDADGTPHTFMPGDLVRIKVYKKKKAEDVVLQKDFHITTPTQKVQIYLSKEDTKIGEIISKPVTYWYSIALINPDNEEQTIIGYDDEMGAKTFVLLPEGGDKIEEDNEQEAIPPENVDNEIDINSTLPVSNQAVARAILRLEAGIEALTNNYVTPEFYGAIGDGEADDTEAIRQACMNEKGLPVMFGPKTYIINIVPEENVELNCFFHNPTATRFIGVNGKTVIKLGSNDNCNAADGKGFESIFRFGRSDKDIVFDGITFDFNYNDNIIHHKSWKAGTVENNIQQLAIACYYVKSLRVSNCTFKDHSGTNVINFRANKELSEGRCIVEGCMFTNIGNASIYKGEDAYHDHSTLSIHCDNTGNHDFEYIARVENNYFQGVGGNAFNACECSASNFVFRNNIVESYAIGVQPLSDYDNTVVVITENTFKRVGCAVAVNCNHIDNVRTDGECAFDEISIHGNNILIDAVRVFSTPTYESLNNVVGGYYKGSWIGVVQGINSIKKSINVIRVNDNNVVFVDVNGLSDELFEAGNYYNGCFLNFSNTAASGKVFLNTIAVENNRVENLPSRLISLVPYTAIKEFVVRGNEIINPFRRKMNQAYINGGLIGITSNLDTIDLVDISNNYVDYAYSNTFYGAVFITTSDTGFNGKAILKMVDNVCLKPYYGLLQETGANSPFKYKVIRETYLA